MPYIEVFWRYLYFSKWEVLQSNTNWVGRTEILSFKLQSNAHRQLKEVELQKHFSITEDKFWLQSAVLEQTLTAGLHCNTNHVHTKNQQPTPSEHTGLHLTHTLWTLHTLNTTHTLQLHTHTLNALQRRYNLSVSSCTISHNNINKAQMFQTLFTEGASNFPISSSINVLTYF